MSECVHDLVEKENSWADGLCAHCLQSELAAVKKELEEEKASYAEQEKHCQMLCNLYGKTKTDFEEAKLLNRCFKELFFSAMSDDSNTGKVIRLRQASEKIRFMDESEEQRQMVLREFRAWEEFRGRAK